MAQSGWWQRRVEDSTSVVENLKSRLAEAEIRLAEDKKNLGVYNEEQSMARVMHELISEYVRQEKPSVVVGQVTTKSYFRVKIIKPSSRLYCISFRCIAGNTSYPYEIALLDENDQMYKDEDEDEYVKGFMDVSKLLAAFAELLK